MKSIPQAILNQIENGEITSFNLVELYIDDTWYYYTNCEVPIYYATDGTNSNTYNCLSFSFSNVIYSNANFINSCDIDFDNLDSVMLSLFANNTFDDDPINLYTIYFDNNNDIIDSFAIFNGIINDFEFDEEILSLKATSIFTNWSQTGSNKYSALCRWKKFKGFGCGYVGGQTQCDRSYTRCSELSNTDNYGGFRWLPGIENKPVYWGIPDEKK